MRVGYSDVVFEATPWPRGQFFYVFGLGLEAPGLDLGRGLDRCVDTFWHHSQTQGPTITINKLIIVIIVN